MFLPAKSDVITQYREILQKSLSGPSHIESSVSGNGFLDVEFAATLFSKWGMEKFRVSTVRNPAVFKVSENP